jgi:prepilin-type N-terminal cleavage/methylation domain-containing protein
MKSRRARERGLTLVEVLIVMVIAISLVGGMAFASGQIQRSRLKASSSKVATAMRVAFNRASSTGNDLRLVVDIEQNTIWLEESQEKMLIQSKDLAGTGGADPATEGEKSALAEATRVTQGPQAPRANFTAVPGPAGQPQPLQNGVIVRAIDAAHDPLPKKAGRGYVYFFGAQAERASVQLAIKGSEDDKDTFSIVLAPLTGRPTIMEGPIGVPHGQDDKEASEVEDDGR